MRKFQEQQAALQEAKELYKLRRDKLSGYFFDLSKLSFSGFVVGLVMQLFSSYANMAVWFVLAFGILLTYLSAQLANKILK